MKNKFWLIVVVMTLGILVFGVVSTSAYAYENLSYSISNGKITITGCSDEASGEIIIPGSIDECPVIAIGDEAFKNCVNMTSVTIPESITRIGRYAFMNCTGLETVYWNAVSVYDAYSYDAVFYNAGNKEKGMEVIFGDSVLSIPAYIFIGEANDMGFIYTNTPRITRVTLGKNIKKIGVAAFKNCKFFESIHIPENVSAIGTDAFYGCKGLKEITVDENNNYYLSDEYGVLYDKLQTVLYIFPAESRYTSYSIPSSVYEIADRAFADASNLRNIKLEKDITKIGTNSFNNCGNKTEGICLTIGKNVTSIKHEIYSQITWFKEIVVEEGNTEFCVESGVLYNKDKTSLLKYIPNDAETEFTVPDYVTKIGAYAFYKCSNLTN